MMLKVNGAYLDFNGDVELERQVKLLEQIDETRGDFSYSFELQWTDHNFYILGIPLPDNVSKVIYSNVQCDLLDNDGDVLHRGFLRIEGYEFRKIIRASFFSGNYNWMRMITGDLSELDFSEFNVDLTKDVVLATMTSTSEITFPFMDIGGLLTRSEPATIVEDYNGCMYVKTIFNKIFNTAGIKIKGELLADWTYDRAIICKNNKNSAGISDRSSYAKKTSNQIVTDSAAYATILFQDDSTYPYYDGAQNNYNAGTSIYTADVRMNVQVQVSLVISMNTQLNTMYFEITRNGAAYREYSITHINPPSPPTSYNINLTVPLNATDTLQVRVRSVDSLGTSTGVQTGSTLKITPLFLYRVFGNSTIPNWTKQAFVTNVINLFNVITDFDPVTKELTFNFFEDLKSKPPIDLSEFIKIKDVDFEELISNFGRNNNFSYQENDDESLKEYNVKEFIKYGQGVIEVDNDFIQESVDVIESDFSAPTSYINGIFNASLEKISFIEYEDGVETTFASVSNASNKARFNIADDVFVFGDLVRISESTHAAYNGEWVIENIGSGYIEFDGLSYNVSASGKVTKIDVTYTNDDSVYILLHIPEIPVPDISSLATIKISDASASGDMQSVGYTYFNLLNTGRAVNDDYKQSLSFGVVENDLFYQRTLLETYWRSIEGLLNDPVKIPCEGNLPKSVYLSLTPLVPVTIKTEQTSNMYYVNRITGYKSQAKPCEIELIKLA